MNAKAEKIFIALENQRKEVTKAISELSEEEFQHKPRHDKWSVSQILTHLITSEQMSLGYMRKKANGIEHLRDSGVKELLLIQVLKLSQRIPSIKFRAPKIVLQNTPEPLSLLATIQQWERDRNELKLFLEDIPDRYIHRLIYKHPIAGRLNVLQALIFYREHIIHHWPQIKRLLHHN